jgi:hypothetical protein
MKTTSNFYNLNKHSENLHIIINLTYFKVSKLVKTSTNIMNIFMMSIGNELSK